MNGSNYYLYNKLSNECAVFDSFGKLVNIRNGVPVSLIRNSVNVDIVSILNTNSGGRECEICLNGKKKVFNVTATNAMIAVRKLGNYIGTIFTSNTEIDGETIVQVFFSFRENTVSWSILDNILCDRKNAWEDL